MGFLDGKAAVITGGSRGFGFAMAQAFLREGAMVCIAGRDLGRLEAALAELKTGGRVAGLPADVSDLAQVERLAAFALETFGRLDIWVNNAGIAGPYGPTVDLDPGDFRRVVETNILGVYYGSRTSLRIFREQGSGKLINLLGHGADGPVPWQNAYASSKGWIKSFTMALAKETKDSAIGVYAYSPGMLKTELLTDIQVVEGSEKRLERFPAVVRILSNDLDRAADKAAWLASSATDGKTGLVVRSPGRLRMLAQAITRLAARQPDPAVQITRVPKA